MTPTVVARDGETIDEIVWRHYGRQDVIAQVLEANSHLAQRPPVLRAGEIVYLPDLPLPAPVPIIRLWS